MPLPVKPTGALSQTEWVALDALTYDSEPVEVVDGAFRGAGLSMSADEFLAVMFCLFSRGFITIRQTPISALGQEFSKRDVIPSQPQEVVGDLHQLFREYYAAGDYLHRVALPAGTPPAGIPFGIYFELTAAGRTECNKPIYKSLWQSNGG